MINLNEVNYNNRVLLTKKQAAERLGYKSTAILKNIPIKPIRISNEGIGKAWRFDSRAIDAYIDELSGFSPKTEKLSEAEQAQAELETWMRSRVG